MGALTKAESIKQDNNPTCRECRDKLVFDSNWIPSYVLVPIYLCNLCSNSIRVKRKTRNKERAIEYLGGKCKDCGGVYIQDVYDFHHRDPTQKEMQPNRMFRLKWEKIKPELDKCDLLCANCHRTRHYKERISA
jgi:hypothetical protein